MIFCDRISKSYNENLVLNNFTYNFPDAGFILLFGESGCGKSTLINILSGLVEYSSGSVTFSNYKTYYEKVNADEIIESIAYITQDAILVRQLTVIENLKLVTDDMELINRYCEEFGISHILFKYPENISGGEKQRVALVMALLQDKRIFLFDEPTAALDEENKILIFSKIKVISENALVICSSHDSIAKEFADDIIYMNSSLTLPKNIDIIDAVEKEKSYVSIKREPLKEKKERLSKAFKEIKKYPKKEKKSKYILFFVIIINFIVIGLCDTPNNKLASNLKYIYNNNQFVVIVDDDENNTFQQIINDENVKEVNMIYSLSQNNEITDDIDSCVDNSTHNTMSYTLPKNIEMLNLDSIILYGTYFTDVNQIILPYSVADNMGNPERLVGSKMNIEYSDGVHEMLIVGVLREFTESESMYLTLSGIYGIEESCDEEYCISGEFVDKFHRPLVDNKECREAYVVYFNDFDDMYACYKKYVGKEAEVDIVLETMNPEVKGVFNLFSVVMYPIAIILLIVSMLLYFQIKGIEMEYNSSLYSSLQYYGNDMKHIKKNVLKTSIVEVLSMNIIALAIYIVVMLIVNAINMKELYVVFQIFTFNIYLVLAYFIVTIALSILMTRTMLNKLNKIGWYYSIIGNRDLL